MKGLFVEFQNWMLLLSWQLYVDLIDGYLIVYQLSMIMIKEQYMGVSEYALYLIHLHSVKVNVAVGPKNHAWISVCQCDIDTTLL